MRKWICFLSLAGALAGLLVLPACPRNEDERDYRQDMRDFVQRISTYAKETNPDFAVIPQNGNELLTTDGLADGPVATNYIDAIDGVGREDLFYGYDDDNTPTPAESRDYMLGFVDLAEANGVQALVIDYCSDEPYVTNSYTWNEDHGFISFAADHRNLDDIPSFPAAPFNRNQSDIRALAEARNFLFLLEPSPFGTKQVYLDALAASEYDLFVIDLFFNEEPLAAADVASLKTKPQGGSRLVICYMSIGEAENYRYYWQQDWAVGEPDWIVRENPNWEGNFIVRYWESEWQDIILGGPDAYLDRILAAGFDGVYLDIIDAFEAFEEK